METLRQIPNQTTQNLEQPPQPTINISQVNVVESHIIEGSSLHQPPTISQAQPSMTSISEERGTLITINVDEEGRSHIVNASMIESEVAISGGPGRGDVKMSVTDMQIDSNLQTQYQRYMTYDSTRRQVPTQLIIKDSQEEEGISKENEDDIYFMGYFKWFWERHGFWHAVKSFFGRKMLWISFYNVFNSMGIAIGTFFFRHLVIKRYGLIQYC